MTASPDTAAPRDSGDGQTLRDEFDAIVIGAGHNGLVTATYLARAGMRTLLLEARASVGGTAASEAFGGATVNICNCDHLTFRTTPVIDELGLAGHGLRYLDVEPAQLNMTWDDPHPWPSFHDVDRTIDVLNTLHPAEVEGYRRYLRAAVPAVQMVFAAAAEPPSVRHLVGTALRKKLHGTSALLGWSRKSAADVMRSFFTSEALRAPALAIGPMVWGISPETPGSGLGALTYAMRHVGTLGRPVGGSGAVTDALAAAFVARGGELRTGHRVSQVRCDSTRVRGVVTADGHEFDAPIVVSACDPHRTFLEWLTDPPAAADRLLRRWRAIPQSQGYEAKIDAVMTAVPRLRVLDDARWASLGIDVSACTTAVAPSLADMHRGALAMSDGAILEHPAMIFNVPTVLDVVINRDTGKSRQDALIEVFMTVDLLNEYTKHAAEWLRAREVPRGLRKQLGCSAHL
ncbi:MAG TPA: FAD-dependent oxidoreductase, partial [Ilumatobacteraceae bacterium]|nr:FAD-dependent oxidoreductase [Ilumatobacteraceae bacterium]